MSWILRFCGVGVALLGVTCSRSTPPGPPPEPPPVKVQVVTTERSQLPLRRAAVGSLMSPETITVAADVSGIVVFLDTPEGRPVPARHLLARLDDSEATAARNVAGARAENARAELERIRPLYEDEVVPRQVLDDAVAELATAEGLLEEARARLEKTYVRAPFAGVLGIRTADLGQYVSSGDPIVQLTRVRPLELVFGLPERYAPELRLGLAVLGQVGDCGPRFDAQVTAIDPTVDPATRTVSLKALVSNPNGSLKPGMSARVRVVVGVVPDALIIPQEAVVRQGTRYLVWVLDAHNAARQQPVTLGEFLADGVHVRQGLEAGARVVVAGFQKLRPGAPTVVEDYAPTTNPLLELGTRPDGTDCGWL